MPAVFTEVTDTAALAKVVSEAQEEGLVAIDTEFKRMRTYFPIAGLYQLKIGEVCYLVDPIAIADLTPLKELLDSPAVVKIMHACREDLALFDHHLGICPAGIFDTQIAAAFVGYPYSVGYQGMVAEVLDIELEKGERMSDWLRRPLTDEQKKYAAEDVEHLPNLYSHLQDALQRLGRHEWYQDEMQNLYTAAQADPAQQWHNYARSWSLKDVAVLRFQKLWQWREDYARKRDLPKQWLAGDKLLHELAREDDPSAEIFAKHNIKNPKLISRMRDVLSSADNSPPAEWPDRSPRPLELDEKDLLTKLQNAAKAKAKLIDIPSALLVTKKMLNSLVHCHREQLPMPDWWQGWRREVLGEQYLSGIVD